MNGTAAHVPAGATGAQRAPAAGRAWLLLAGVLVIATLLLVLFPDRRAPATDVFWTFLVEMLTVIPAVLIIMGAFAVWVPKEMITRHLGRSAGARGLALALLLGTLPTGPLYAAFPFIRGLLDKGASLRNAFALMAAWACIKPPQELFEIQFLGWRFALARLLITLAVVIALAHVFPLLLADPTGGADREASEATA
ncbi:MAG: permease [Trueperaceae bacterium]|nr:permease [Trueperaceae bacterium]